MKVKIWPAKGALEGTVTAPPSKSYTHRYLACALLAKGESRLRNPSMCADAVASLRACKSLGATIRKGCGELALKSAGSLKKPRDVINCGGSGTTLRFFTAISSLAPGLVVLTGNKSLKRRPMAPLIASLRRLGVECYALGDNDTPPIVVFGGGVDGGCTSVEGNVSSQFVSALMMALVKARRPSRIEISEALESKGYVEMTIKVLREFGGRIEASEDFKVFEFQAPQELIPVVAEVPGDYSIAAFFAVAGAIVEGSRVRIERLAKDDVQPEREFVSVLEEAGAKVFVGPSWLEVEGSSDLSSFKFNAKDNPDLVPPLLALASFCKGETVIKGCSRLKFKESNRLESLPTELKRVGVDVRVEGDSIVVRGRRKVKGSVVSSWMDHRVAMSLALVGLRSERGLIIEGFEVVSKSHPGFVHDLAKLGVMVDVVS
jgi:3-phosphoshikimate 1-carboxyvinyltransferase